MRRLPRPAAAIAEAHEPDRQIGLVGPAAQRIHFFRSAAILLDDDAEHILMCNVIKRAVFEQARILGDDAEPALLREVEPAQNRVQRI